MSADLLPASPWAFAPAEHYDVDGEPLPCRGSYTGHPEADSRTLSCVFSFDHREVNGEDEHGIQLGAEWFSWTDADAANMRQLIRVRAGRIAAEALELGCCAFCGDPLTANARGAFCDSTCLRLDAPAEPDYDLVED